VASISHKEATSAVESKSHMLKKTPSEEYDSLAGIAKKKSQPLAK
jgi:hypothetical protein